MTNRMAVVQARGLALVRISVGVLLLSYGIQKLSPRFSLVLPTMLYRFAAQNPHALYRDFLLRVAVPHAGLVAALVVLGELVLGACFVLGLAIGLTGPLAALLFANYYYATSHLGAANAWGNLLMVISSLVFSVAYGGCSWGVDGELRHRVPLRALYPLGLGGHE